MLLLLEQHISTVFYVGFVYVCIPRQGPGGHVHPGAAVVLVVCLLLLIYSLLIYMWM